MSDTIWKWARRTVEELTIADQPLDLEHLAAIAEAATSLVHERLPGKLYSESPARHGQETIQGG